MLEKEHERCMVKPLSSPGCTLVVQEQGVLVTKDWRIKQVPTHVQP